MTRLVVIERATEDVFQAERIEGGYVIYTEEGEKYKKVKDSTFKKYFKATGNTVDPEKKAEPAKKSKPAKTVNVDPEKREKMIEKVKKMMSLAQNNSSEEEAIAAALQAQKLMAKYNIHEDEVSVEDAKIKILSIVSSQKHDSNLHEWRKQLASVVASNFRCKTYIMGADIAFRGYKEDARLAHDVYIMLYTVGNKMGSAAYKTAVKEDGSGKGVYNSFVMGFLKGVKDAFDEQCTALMVVTPKEVTEEYKEFSANFKTSKTSISISNFNESEYKEGYAQGKKAVKGRSVESK